MSFHPTLANVLILTRGAETPGRLLEDHWHYISPCCKSCDAKSDIETLLKVAANTSVLASIHSFNKKQNCAINNF